MDALNYHHLLYFWTVARLGGVTAASEELHVAQPTVSAQLKTLERQLGQPLFERVGRGMRLTNVGRTVFSYADEIFRLGRELTDVVAGRAQGGPLRLAVGVADVVPKLVAHQLIAPATRLEQPVHLVCREGKLRDLIGQLTLGTLDVVLADAPPGPTSGDRLFVHRLGSFGLTVFASPTDAAPLRTGFPDSLRDTPWLMPTPESTLRRTLEQWLSDHDLPPRVVGEFDDSALLKVFGSAGYGVFAAPESIRQTIEKQLGVEAVGQLDGAEIEFFAISRDRRTRHAGVAALTSA